MFHDIDVDASLTTQEQDCCATLRTYGDYAVEGFGLQIARLFESGWIHE